MIVISAKYFCEVTKNARNDGHLNITKYGKLTFILLQIDGYWQKTETSEGVILSYVDC